MLSLRSLSTIAAFLQSDFSKLISADLEFSAFSQDGISLTSLSCSNL
ncbi:hypothetical protein [Phormidesmis sp. 146-33]